MAIVHAHSIHSDRLSIEPQTLYSKPKSALFENLPLIFFFIIIIE